MHTAFKFKINQPNEPLQIPSHYVIESEKVDKSWLLMSRYKAHECRLSGNRSIALFSMSSLTLATFSVFKAELKKKKNLSFFLYQPVCVDS